MGSSNPNDHGKLKISNKTQAKIFHITREKMCPCFLTEGWLLYLVGWVKELINNPPDPRHIWLTEVVSRMSSEGRYPQQKPGKMYYLT